jgi:hypothetical protein
VAELFTCERCDARTIALIVAITCQAVCSNCLTEFEQPEKKLYISNNLENRSISKVKQYLARNRRKG